jgi:hypothetical protein
MSHHAMVFHLDFDFRALMTASDRTDIGIAMVKYQATLRVVTVGGPYRLPSTRRHAVAAGEVG